MITEELKKLYCTYTGHEPEAIEELPSSGSNRRYFRLTGHPYPYRCQRDFPRRESGFPLYGRPFPQERTARATSRSKE